MDKIRKLVPTKKRQILILTIVISMFIAFGAYQFYKWEAGNIRLQKEKILTAIATLKIKQIENWYIDKLNDSQIISKNPVLIEKTQNYFKNPTELNEEQLLGLLNQIKIEHDYTDVILTSLEGEVFISTDELVVNLNPVEKTILSEAINKKKSLCTDLFLNEHLDKQPVLISFVSVGGNQNNNTPFALILRMDPDDFLYPLLDIWPIPSNTSETFIFRVENDNIIYLNNLRHKNIKVLDYKIPLSNADLPAVKAAAGFKGIYRDKDYRNLDVFAYMDKIKDTPWFLIAKIDKSEMFDELPLLAIYVIGFALLCILTVGSVLTVLYNRRQKTIYAELYKKEKEIWQQQEKFKVTLDSLGEGVITLDINGKVQYMNNLAEDLSGWNLREARGRYLGEIYAVKNEETGEPENNILEKVLKHGIVKELANHTILISKSGKEIPVMDTGAPIYDSDGSVIGIVIAFQDETEKRTQQRLIKESENRFRSSLDNMIEGCQIIGYDYKYLFLNKAALQSSRKTSEELLGKTIMECYPGIEKTEMFRKLKSCMEDRIPENFENEFTYPDGEKKFFNLRFEPVPEGIFILSEDITDYKFAQDFILKFKMGIELSGDAIFLTDKDGIITYVNPAFEKIFGYSKEEAIGNTPRILKSGILDQEYYEKFWQDILAKKAVSHEIVNKTKDNKLLFIEASINSIISEKNEVHGFIAIERDITERKLAEEKRKQLTAIMEATPDFVATADAKGNSIFINNAGKKMLGLEPDEDVTKITIADAHPDWARKIVLDEGLPTAAKEGFWIGETAFLHRDGYETPISQIIIAHKSESENVVYYSTIARDITQRKRFEEELILAKNKAEEMNEVKTLFFANMSHELRTPFVGIMGYAELLVDELKDPDHNEMAKGILSTSKRMVETLTKILTLSKLEIKGIELNQDKVDLQDLFDTIQKEFSVTIDKKNLLFKKSIEFDDTVVQTDKSLLFDIMHNLVHNAVNYTNEGEISLKAEKKIQDEKEILVINVSDTGIGIPKDKQEIVWQEFRQVSEGRTRSYQGTGLGLTIVKKYTELLGGNIYLQSEEGKGSTFSVELPISG